ncbi:MAG: hypothetical protein V4629_02345 [Pseudomonadota bacterium]
MISPRTLPEKKEIIENSLMACSMADFIKKVRQSSNIQNAEHMIPEQAGAIYDGYYGDQTTLSMELKQLDARCEESAVTLAELSLRKRSTKRHVKSAYVSTGSNDNNKNPIRFNNWNKRDQAYFILTAIFLLISMVMGTANVYSNLVESGITIFIEKPHLALCLSLLVPAASCSLKFVSNFIDFYKNQRKYGLCIYILTGITLLVWTVFFSLNFNGVSSSFNAEEMEGFQWKGSCFVWIQLLSEILVSASLFLALEDIFNKYSPDYYCDNLEYVELDAAWKIHCAEHKALTEECAEKRQHLNQFIANRQAFINSQVAEYNSQRAKFSAVNNFYQ